MQWSAERLEPLITRSEVRRSNHPATTPHIYWYISNMDDPSNTSGKHWRGPKYIIEFKMCICDQRLSAATSFASIIYLRQSLLVHNQKWQILSWLHFYVASGYLEGWHWAGVSEGAVAGVGQRIRVIDDRPRGA